jgi:hypothetical protein
VECGSDLSVGRLLEFRSGQPMQASSRSRSGRRYPRHGPLVGEATEEGSYTLRCLACGVKGPEREDTLKAKLAFDETFVANRCS